APWRPQVAKVGSASGTWQRWSSAPNGSGTMVFELLPSRPTDKSWRPADSTAQFTSGIGPSMMVDDAVRRRSNLAPYRRTVDRACFLQAAGADAELRSLRSIEIAAGAQMGDASRGPRLPPLQARLGLARNPLDLDGVGTGKAHRIEDAPNALEIDAAAVAH